MIYQVLYKASVTKDLRTTDKKEIGKIIDGVEKQIAQDPVKGSPLKGEFEGFYRHSIGKYRMIYRILGDSILVLRISHTKD